MPSAVEVPAVGPVTIPITAQEENKFYTGHTDNAKAGCPPKKYVIKVFQHRFQGMLTKHVESTFPHKPG